MNRAVHIEFLSLDFQKAMEGSRKHSVRYPYIHYTKHLKKPVGNGFSCRENPIIKASEIIKIYLSTFQPNWRRLLKREMEKY